MGLVHTMGNLHPGHLSMCQRSLKDNDITVVVIYVNQTQFNDQGDYDNYPRTLDRDRQLLGECGIDYLLVPNKQDMYPDDYTVQLNEIELSKHLEGENRPGHFNGMLTIVLKILNLVRPTSAYYGEKDYQQLLLIRKMTQALMLTPWVNIVGCPTIREDSGLAMSSRNSRLSVDGRKKASHLYAILRESLTPVDADRHLREQGFQVDYVIDRWDRRLAAVRLEGIRLIDNLPLNMLGKRETSV
ncbi:pantothenate synthetase-like [Oppia nitens]|uniref:pantothenate synthetase-like n=1 Tax=Oppia nitens TaxID=1686743 RepID=UPI0023DA961C|nr:pantothenate synthetase-like [Oppia nitens]